MHEWSKDPKNLIILPSRGEPNTFARTLFDQWNENAGIDVEHNRPAIQLEDAIETVLQRSEPLSKEELEEHNRAKEEGKTDQPTDMQVDDDDNEDELDQLNLHDTFDVYMKHTATGFFKNLGVKMFPVTDHRRKFDDYGDMIDPEEFMKGDYQQAIDQNVPEKKLDDIESEVVEEVPVKYFEEPATLDLKCKLVYIDFEGRVDGVSIKNILQQVNPKKLVLVNGDEESYQDLKDFCLEKDSMTKDFHVPIPGKPLNVSHAKHLYSAIISDDIFSSLNFKKVHISLYFKCSLFVDGRLLACIYSRPSRCI